MLLGWWRFQRDYCVHSSSSPADLSVSKCLLDLVSMIGEQGSFSKSRTVADLTRCALSLCASLLVRNVFLTLKLFA